MSELRGLFSLSIPGEVICGCGSIKRLSELIEAEGAHSIALFVDAGVLNSGCADDAIAAVKASADSVVMITDVPPEPEDRQIREIFEKVKNSGAELVVAIGGGSVIDASKMISVMLTNPEFHDDLTDRLAIRRRGVPLFAVPTSAGTGSEATPNSIVLIPEKKLKVGVVHPYFLPAKVVLDPELTRSLPKAVTASTGLDAFCHCIETFISRKTNPFARLFGSEGMSLICRYLRRAYNDGNDMEAREGMLMAAFCGGVAISCSSTVAVHALSYPLGGTYRIPHGVSNAILLPFVMEYNMPAISGDVKALASAMEIDVDGLSEKSAGERLVEEIYALCRDTAIPDRLTSFGVTPDDLEFLAVSASEVHRLLDQNPRDMSVDDIRSIYSKLL